MGRRTESQWGEMSPSVPRRGRKAPFVVRLQRRLARRHGLDLVPSAYMESLERFGGRIEPPTLERTRVPDDARARLRRDHPRLLELKDRYEGHPAAAASLWTDEYRTRHAHLFRFRGEAGYLWQVRANWIPEGEDLVPQPTREITYLATAQYAERIDRLGVLAQGDDDLFGNMLVEIEPGRSVSRELLESTLELNFLERHLGLSERERFTVLDIGAGYGRFAHRLTGSTAGASVLCTDAVPESTFLSEFYLAFRGVEDVARVIPLDEIEAAIDGRGIDLAVNMYSFSEMPLSSIQWWLDLISAAEAEYLFIAPNTQDRLLSLEPDRTSRDLLPEIERRGYERVAMEPKYGAGSLQRHGLYPSWFHLFRRRAS